METRDLRLVGSQAREEADHRVVGGLSTVRRVPEPALSGDEARSVLGGERLREPGVTANRAGPDRIQRDILERVHGGAASLYRRDVFPVVDHEPPVRQQPGAVVVADALHGRPTRPAGGLPQKVWHVASVDLSRPERFEARVSDDFEFSAGPDQGHPVVRDPDRLADHQVCLWSAVGAASGLRE